MAEKDERIIFTTEDGEEIAFYVVEQTTLAGETFLLVADSEEEEANALILREIKGEKDEDVWYAEVEDDEQLEALSKVFEELLENVDIEM